MLARAAFQPQLLLTQKAADIAEVADLFLDASTLVGDESGAVSAVKATGAQAFEYLTNFGQAEPERLHASK